MTAVKLDEAQRLWQPETLYLNTASYGLPPTPAWEEFQSVLADWRGGRTSWEGWGDYTESARTSFARLVGVPTEWIAIGANTSSMVGLVAASLPDGARVVSTEPEFTSLLWPFMVQGRGIEVGVRAGCPGARVDRRAHRRRGGQHRPVVDR